MNPQPTDHSCSFDLKPFISGRGAAEAEQRGELERRDADDGHQPHQDGHHRLQPAHPETGKQQG